MLSEKMQKQLNDQMNYEIFSGHYYLAMAAYCESIDLSGIANYFLVQQQEEFEHGMKFYHYILERDAEVNFTGMDDPKSDYKNLEEVFTVALGHEKKVTARIHKLMELAIQENDFATQSFLKWFVDEQVEEEAHMLAILKKLNFVGESKHALFMLDRELGQRKAD